MKDEYRIETNKTPYAESNGKRGLEESSTGTYSDDYVRWLENKCKNKRCLSDIEIEYKHPSGKKKGVLMYDDDEYQTLMLKYDGGFINLPNIEDCKL